MSDLDHELRQGGDKVAEGEFRVDASRALERLRHHRLADPSHWVLEVLRAAVASQAAHVTVRTDADDVEVDFDGKPFPAAVMKDLVSHALGKGGDARARLLALGVAAATGLDPKRLVVESGGVKLTIARGQLVTEKGERDGTHVALRKKASIALAKAFLLGSPEAAAISARCRRYPAALVVDGWKRPAPDVKVATLREAGLEISWSLAPLGQVLSEVTLDVLGVEVSRRDPRLPGVQLLSVIASDEMRRNASGTDVVSNDPALARALSKLDAISLELLQEQAASVQRESNGALEDHFRWRLMEDDLLTDAARRILEAVPLLEGPAGERVSIAQVKANAQQAVYFAKQRCPPGTYPEGTVLLDFEAERRYVPLIPPGNRVDVAPMVRRRARAAEARARWERQRVESLELPERDWLGTARFEGKKLRGKVGISDAEHGAFVRLSAGGRFLEESEVLRLAPLRLRARVDFTGEIPADRWSDFPSPELWSLVADHVAEAAVHAIVDPPWDPKRLGHAVDLLELRLNHGDGIASLPAGLREAPLFECLGGGERVSLAELAAQKPWRYTTQRRHEPLLSGKRVLLLAERSVQLLGRLGKDKLRDVGDQLEDEKSTRWRMLRPKEQATVGDALCRVAISADGVTGEAALVGHQASPLDVHLYRDGFLLERSSTSARFAFVAAAVDCPALTPTESWDGAVRDAAFERAIRAVREGERALGAEIVKRWRWADMPTEARRYLLAFTQKELRGNSLTGLAPLARAVADAPIFDALDGAVSLAGLEALLLQKGRLWHSQAIQDRRAVEGLAVLIGDSLAAELVAAALSVALHDTWPLFERARARRRFEAEPETELTLGSLPFQVEVEYSRLSCRFALSTGLMPGAQVKLVVDKRLWRRETVPAALSLRGVAIAAGADPTEAPPDELRARLARAVALGQEKILAAALAEAGRPDARRVIACALHHGLDRGVPEAQAEQLRRTPFFACTDGTYRSAAELSVRPDVAYCTASLDGAPRAGYPVVLATGPVELHALGRFPERTDVTEPLSVELNARRMRAKRARVDEVRFSRPALVRERVKLGATDGELVLAPREGGRLELLFERVPLCAIDGALNPPLAAAVNCDDLTPDPEHTGVVRDARFHTLVAHLGARAGLLADRLADHWGTARVDDPQGAVECAVRLMVRSGKNERSGHRLGALPMLDGADGTALALDELLAEAKAHKSLLVSSRKGALLRKVRRPVWLADAAQREWLRPLKLKLIDVSAELEKAEAVRSRAKVAQLAVASSGRWRESVAGEGLEGEVVLPEQPGHPLEIEVVHQRARLERWQGEHPIGGEAIVEGAALTPNADWTKVARNAQFRRLIAAVDAALERLLVRRVTEDASRSQAWRAWVEAAVRWKGKEASHPLAAPVSACELFDALDGRPVTVGAVLAEYARARRVAVAGEGVAASGELVLRSDDRTLELLDALGVTTKDVTSELTRKGELEAARLARRLTELSWPGDALVRHTVTAPGFTGELALPADLGRKVEVTLAKLGVAVSAVAPGVSRAAAGVIDVAGLAVDESWTEARLTPEQRLVIAGQVIALYAALARAAPDLPEGRRPMARHHALRWLEVAGMKSAEHLDRLEGVSVALAEAPFFETVEGEWVSLAALVAEVERRGRVSVFARTLFKPDTAGVLALKAGSVRETWLELLESVLGKGAVERVEKPSEWRERQREEDPPRGSPELSGLERLRRDVRLLRVGSLGHLSADELEDVRLRELGGKTPVQYDAGRNVALLDAGHPQVKRALAESAVRRERLYVLLAAIYGAVNRELSRITDAHEAQLAAALAAHLAANPQLLER